MGSDPIAARAWTIPNGTQAAGCVCPVPAVPVNGSTYSAKSPNAADAHSVPTTTNPILFICSFRFIKSFHDRDRLTTDFMGIE